MVKSKAIFIMICILLFSITSQAFTPEIHVIQEKIISTEMMTSSEESMQHFSNPRAYTSSSPIYITNNNDLNNSFPGRGTINDPIKIDGYEITSSNERLIYIRDTTFYFQISNNKLNSSLSNGSPSEWQGITLQNVQHCEIANNTILSCSHGIEFWSSKNCTIINNTISNSKYNGIKLRSTSNYNSISNNTIYDSIIENGIWLEASSNNTIYDNIVYNTDDGIRLLESSNDNEVINNTCFNNRWVGIRLQSYADKNVIINNTIHHNTEHGIKIEVSSNDNTVDNNTVYSNLQHGIEAASANNNIISHNIAYNNTWAGISLYQCYSSNNSIINNILFRNKWAGIAIHEYSSNNTIKNNTVYNNTWEGIILRDSDNNTITNNSAYNNYFGIRLERASNNTVRNNTVYSNLNQGIFLELSSNNTLSNNMAFNNTQNGILIYQYSKSNTLCSNTVYNNAYGIYIYKSADNLIIGNNLTNNGFIIHTDVSPPDSDPGNLEDCLQGPVINNTVNRKPFVYWENVVGDIIPSGAGQVILINCTDITVNKQNLNNNSIGVVVVFSSNITLYNNTVYNNRYGIFLTHSDNNTLFNYTGYNNKFNDIVLFGKCNNNVLSNNTVGNNADIGISINWDSKNNTIINNTVFNSNEGGIRILNSENNTISHNLLYNNKKYGINVDETSNYTTIKFNELIGNNNGKSQAADNGSENIFIYNYWSDWLGSDANTDGLVDVPYSIEGTSNNHDPFPLVISPSVHYILTPLIKFPKGGEFLAKKITISWTPSTDTWGYDVSYAISYSANGGTSWTLLKTNMNFTSYQWDTTTVSEGSNYLLKVEAFSTGGLSTTAVTGNTFTIDNTPPSIIIKSPVTMTYTTKMITVSLSGDATDYWYWIESGDTQNQTWTTNVTRTLTDGIYILHAYGNDSAGNLANTSVKFTIDSTPPTIKINSPLTQIYTTETITVTLSGDATHYWYYIESIDSQNQTWTANITRTLADGNYTLHAYGNDSIGNIAYIFVTFTILTTPTTTTTITTTTTSTTITTSTTSTTYTTSKITPGWNILLIFCALMVILTVKFWKKKS